MTDEILNNDIVDVDAPILEEEVEAVDAEPTEEVEADADAAE
jgi:hypothetical protein